MCAKVIAAPQDGSQAPPGRRDPGEEPAVKTARLLQSRLRIGRRQLFAPSGSCQPSDCLRLLGLPDLAYEIREFLSASAVRLDQLEIAVGRELGCASQVIKQSASAVQSVPLFDGDARTGLGRQESLQVTAGQLGRGRHELDRAINVTQGRRQMSQRMA